MQETRPELACLRVLIVHDWIMSWAGSERCVEQLLQIFPHADLTVGIIDPALRDLNEVTRRARQTWLARIPGAKSYHRWLLPVEGIAFSCLDTERYDLVISSSHALSKMVRVRDDAFHLCYCYSPPRYLWDLEDVYRARASRLQRVALAAAAGPLRRWDRKAAQRVDHFIGISRYIADRIVRCYGRVADVVFPPVVRKVGPDTELCRGDFLLHLGRLVPYKRVDLAIAAADLLGVPLVVAGDGPDRTRLERVAGKHVHFLGNVTEEKAGELLSTCAAFVFCAEEDFGIAPVEANAHGAPVVGYGRGGLLETMIPGQTAEFFDEPHVEAVAGAIERALTRKWDTSELRRNAERFSPVSFRQSFTESLRAALAKTNISFTGVTKSQSPAVVATH
jgi:glycosyltransferase involved in cell wall biosynthesis